MVKPWDDSLKKLVHTDPQAFVSWFVPDALFTGERPHELKHWTLEVDALLEVMVSNQEMLLHLEFQTYNDPGMAERLLRYNVLARSEHKLPVLSCVIYLLKDGEAPSSPLKWKLPNGQEVLQFQASLAFSRENRADQDWLLRRFHEMHDILRETPIYQEILKEGREEGLEALRQAVVDIIVQRFPKLARLAKKQVAVVEDPELLRHVLVKVSVVQTAEEAKQHLLALDEADE